MSRIALNTTSTLRPFSQAVICEGLVYLSGCIGSPPDAPSQLSDDLEQQTRQLLQNMSRVLEAAGSSMKLVVKNTVLIKSMDLFKRVNEVYGEFFEEKPARSTFAVAGLPMNALVEIEATALLIKDEKERCIVCTDNAPAPIGPYSQAVKTSSRLFVSGCIGLDPVTKQMVGEDVEAQTAQLMKNMQAVVEAAGLKMENVIKTTVLLQDLADFGKVNAIYANFFPNNPPARSTFGVVGLPMNARVEIEAIVAIPN